MAGRRKKLIPPDPSIPQIKTDYPALIQQFIQEKIENKDLEIKEFADKVKVNYEYFWRLTQKDSTIWEQILNGVRKRYHATSIQVAAALEKKARLGDAKAIELWYRKMEAWGEPATTGNL